MRNKMKVIKFVIFFNFLINLPISEELSIEKFLTLNYKEKLKFDEFKDLVIYRLPHENMQRDVYLIRWLREYLFDVKAAEQALMTNLEWRERNRIDTILDEDWSFFDQRFPASLPGCDKDGKPVVTLVVGDIDIRAQVIAGNSEKFKRYIYSLFEESAKIIDLMQESGDNVTQASVIIDMDKFSIQQHLCPGCIPIYIDALSAANYYPGFAHKIYLINFPDLAVPLYNTLKLILSDYLINLVYVSGKNKKIWQKELLKEIDATQLTKEYGGKKREALDVSEVRGPGKVLSCKVLSQSNE